MLAAFSGQDGRHIAAIRHGGSGSEVTLWSASASGSTSIRNYALVSANHNLGGPLVRTADEFRGKARIVRLHEELYRHIRSRRLTTARRWSCFSVLVSKNSCRCHFLIRFF